MKRMIDEKLVKNKLALPNETNKVFCAQFVADTLVLNNVEKGLYFIHIVNTSGDNNSVSLILFDFKYESTYGTIVSNFFYDLSQDRILALKGEYSSNSKTLTLSLIDTQGVVVQSPNMFHIDIYKVGE